MKIRWGIIGFGSIADRRMAPAIKESQRCELVALMNRDINKARSFAEKYGVKKFYDKAEELVKDKEVDAVYIGSPNFLHYPHTILAAENGKHVLCDKPMALNVKECEEMIKACEKNKVKLMIAYMLRFHACHVLAREIIEKGHLGNIVVANAAMLIRHPTYPNGWRFDPSISGGGAMMDVGVHCLNTLRFLLDSRVREISCFSDISPYGKTGGEVSAILNIRFTNGALGVVNIGLNILSGKRNLEIYGERGTIITVGSMSIDPTGEIKVLIDGKPKDYIVTPQNQYLAEIEHFCTCIEQNSTPLSDGHDGLEDIRIVEAAYRSAQEGKSIKLR